MTSWSVEIWVLLAFITGAGVLAVLNVLAGYLQHEVELHELRVRVGEVRRSYNRRLAEMAAREGGIIEVSPVDEDVAGSIGPAQHRAAA